MCCTGSSVTYGWVISVKSRRMVAKSLAGLGVRGIVGQRLKCPEHLVVC